ncbi:YegP family protein [Roseibacillus persicicus]|uniref:DUF1508 domain-containing protein n=1 Tax=Roseibacillus persicicus TaxID=454148 RepID=A0A918TAS0_9BACT|nr:YegP family protein [Roseibacillus persicicus]MDQ8191385.1 YegP family protein [Roseibacillus persicicus]GHC40106.1 hypothetical protein GCM10007100_00530 [Roseibacillus persicicus]
MFEVFQSESTGKFYFRLKAGNGEVILQSQAYKDKSGALNGVESVKKNGASEDNFETKEAANGKGYFLLKAGNGQTIGQSQQYKTASGLKNGIQSIIKNSGGEVKDLTA